MKPGQVIKAWWQQYVLGALKSPQDVYQAAAFENDDAAFAADRFFAVPEDVGWQAPVRLRAPSRFTQEQYLAQGHKADWLHVDVRLMRWSALFVEYARKRGVPLYVHCALRGEDDQMAALERGVTKAPFPHSAHNIGEAVDIVHSVFHWDLSLQEWQLLGVLGRLALDRVNATLPKAEKLALVWGGDDGAGDRFRWDPAHWEIADYRKRIRRLPVGPPLRYTPRAILARVKL